MIKTTIDCKEGETTGLQADMLLNTATVSMFMNM